MNQFFLNVFIGIACCIAGWLGGSLYTRVSAGADMAGWSWLDTAAIIANADGATKTADAIRGSVNGNFVAKTRALASEYGHIANQDLRERIIQSAKKLSSSNAVTPTGLTLGGAEIANGIISCIAKETDVKATSKCANEVNSSVPSPSKVTSTQ